MRSLLCGLLVVVAACGSANKQPQSPSSGSGSGSGSGSDVVCHEVTDTGSMFSHTECVPADEGQVEHDDAQRYMKVPRSTLSPAASHR